MSLFTRIDQLDFDSREFYERAKLKLSFSLFLASVGMMFLGFTSSFGGQANSANEQALIQFDSSTEKDSFLALASGYGFATFASILAFFISIGAALYVSPLVSSLQEKKILSNPENLQFSDSVSTTSIAISVSVPPGSIAPTDNDAVKPRFAQTVLHEKTTI